MVTRRTLFGLAAVAGLAGCGVDAGVAAKVAKLQKTIAAEPGVGSVDISASLKNESFTTIWGGTVVLADMATSDDQKRLIARFRDQVVAAGLEQSFSGVTFRLPRSIRFVADVLLDTAQATEIIDTMDQFPDNLEAFCVAGTPPNLQLSARLDEGDVVAFFASVTTLAKITRPPSFATTVAVRTGLLPLESAVLCERVLTEGEQAFLGGLPAWLALHQTQWMVVPFDDDEKSLIRLGTVADETVGIRALAEAARSSGIKQKVEGYQGDASTPYVTVPRG